MELRGRIALVTGAGQGIGRAIAEALHAEGAEVIVLDRDAERVGEVAEAIDGLALDCDVTDPKAFRDILERARAWRGRVDILVSNAGMARGEPDGAVSAEEAHWQQSFDLHVMAHLRAVRTLLPDMLARGEGALVNVASAAGLLTQIGDAAYSASKHAAVSLAQSLAIEHGNDGVYVGVVCPLYVATPLIGYGDGDAPAHDRVITADEVAEVVVAGITEERFLILPHAEAGKFFRMRANDPEGWIAAMRRLRGRVMEDGPTDIASLHRKI
ncbi:SDR family NAD(P)-dependent oxidoreductase [Roseivivax sp.]